MRRKINRILAFFCITTFVVTALTSIPLFINYLNNSAIKIQLFVELHVWFGLIFIIFILVRIILNRKFVMAMLKKLRGKQNVH